MRCIAWHNMLAGHFSRVATRVCDMPMTCMLIYIFQIDAIAQHRGDHSDATCDRLLNQLVSLRAGTCDDMLAHM